MKIIDLSIRIKTDMLILNPLKDMKILIKPLSIIDDMFGDVDYVIFNSDLNEMI